MIISSPAMNYQLLKIWKEGTVAYFMILSQNLIVETQKNHRNLLSG
jgi:hypothetical protein